VKIKFSNLLGIGLIFAVATLLVSLPSLNAVELVGASANDVTSSEYNSKDLSLVAQVHAAHLFTDYERRGFFRIGLLPIPVAENVQIQIRSADCLTNALLGLHFWNQPSVGVRRLELRNLEIKLFGEKQPRLSAATARVGQDGILELSTVSMLNATGQPLSIPKATLQAAGSSAGWLHWNFDGQPQDVFLFKPASDKTP
jgi:hypothetical protein